MKYVAAILLLVLSGLLGCAVILNVYVAIATMGNNQMSAITKPNYAMVATFALLAIVFFVGGIAILSQRGDTS